MRPVLLSLLIACAPLPAQTPRLLPSPTDPHNHPDALPLLVLGSYHMEGSSQDAVNLAVGDVRTAAKQRELTELLDRLAAFRPTKILIESPFYRSKAPENYAKFLKGEYVLTANEIDQVAFVLAKRLGHATVFPVDYPMWMDGRVPQEIGTPKPKPKPVNESKPAAPAPVPEHLQRLQDLMAKGTVLDTFRHLNSEAYMRADHDWYVRMLHPDPESTELYEGANLLTNWQKRNLRILANVYRVAEPGDRILLLIGSGHLTVLRQWAEGAQDLALMDTAAYLR
jgi:hypothetical protein